MDSSIHLRKTLCSTTNQMESIQKSASAMMKYYDTPTKAVTEWRNSLQTSPTSKLLTLLYVANEVLQTSKRNRGSKFLEAFSPILKNSLIYICEQDRSVTEKVRRTAKIWGDRRVFSVRFVGDLLQGMNAFREDNKPKEQPKVKKRKASVVASPLSSTSPFEDDGTSHKSSLNVNLDQVLHAPPEKEKEQPPTSGKRPRPSPPKPKALNTSTLQSLLQKLESLTTQYHSSQKTLSELNTSLLTPLDNSIVGDELSSMYTQILQTQSMLQNQLNQLHKCANEIHTCETEIQKYIPYLKVCLQNDKDDLHFVNSLLNKLPLLQVFFQEAKDMRDRERELHRRKMEEEDLERKERLKEEERKQSLKEILVDRDREKKGMVWNSTMREYVNVHDPTNDSWRDH